MRVAKSKSTGAPRMAEPSKRRKQRRQTPPETWGELFANLIYQLDDAMQMLPSPHDAVYFSARL